MLEDGYVDTDDLPESIDAASAAVTTTLTIDGVQIEVSNIRQLNDNKLVIQSAQKGSADLKILSSDKELYQFDAVDWDTKGGDKQTVATFNGESQFSISVVTKNDQVVHFTTGDQWEGKPLDFSGVETIHIDIGEHVNQNRLDSTRLNLYFRKKNVSSCDAVELGIPNQSQISDQGEQTSVVVHATNVDAYRIVNKTTGQIVAAEQSGNTFSSVTVFPDIQYQAQVFSNQSNTWTNTGCDFSYQKKPVVKQPSCNTVELSIPNNSQISDQGEQTSVVVHATNADEYQIVNKATGEVIAAEQSGNTFSSVTVFPDIQYQAQVFSNQSNTWTNTGCDFSYQKKPVVKQPSCNTVELSIPNNSQISDQGEQTSVVVHATNADEYQIVNKATGEVIAAEQSGNTFSSVTVFPDIQYQAQVFSNQSNTWTNTGCDFGYTSFPRVACTFLDSSIPKSTAITAGTMTTMTVISSLSPGSGEVVQSASVVNTSLQQRLFLAYIVRPQKSQTIFYKITGDGNTIMDWNAHPSYSFPVTPRTKYQGWVKSDVYPQEVSSDTCQVSFAQASGNMIGLAAAFDPITQMLGPVTDTVPSFLDLSWGHDLPHAPWSAGNEVAIQGSHTITMELLPRKGQTYISSLFRDGKLLPETSDLVYDDFVVHSRLKEFGDAKGNRFHALEVQIWWRSNAVVSGKFPEWRQTLSQQTQSSTQSLSQDDYWN